MEIAEFYLEEAGAQVIKAWNGQEALAMTAQASTESIHQCELAGMNECIFKPVNAKELIGLLQDIVEKI